MNLPDITLLFQMLHFYVAYKILKYFVFAPALRIINQDIAQQQTLENKITQAHTQHATLLEKCNQRWKFIQESLRNNMPSLPAKMCFDHTKIAQKPTPQTILTKQQQDDIKKMLKQKLSDVEV